MSFFLSPLLPPGRGRLQHCHHLRSQPVAEETLSYLPWGGPGAQASVPVGTPFTSPPAQSMKTESVSANAQAGGPFPPLIDLAEAENVGGLAGGLQWPQSPPHHTLEGDRHKEGWHGLELSQVR